MRFDFCQRMIVLVVLVGLTTVRADEPDATTDNPIATTTSVPAKAEVQLETIVESTPASEQRIDWVTSYNEARKKGTKSDRPVMLFVTMEQCGYCQKLNDESFVAHTEELRKSFVPTKLYLDPESNLGKNLEITIFPTTMFIAPDGKILGYIRGYVPREKFSAELRAAKVANDELVRLARTNKKDDSGLE